MKGEEENEEELQCIITNGATQLSINSGIAANNKVLG